MSKAGKGLSRLVCLLLAVLLAMPAGLGGKAVAFAQSENQSWNIRFQSQAAASEGWLADQGEVFGPHNNGQYGWNHDVTGQTVTQATYEDDPQDTFIRATQDDQWEIMLDNGDYKVSVTVGDAVYSSFNSVYAEDVRMAKPVQIEAGHQLAIEQEVAVIDGRLTLSFNPEPNGIVALRSVTITPVEEPTVTGPSTPRIEAPPEARKVSGNKVLISGQSTNPYASPELIQVSGLDQAISIHMDDELKRINDSIQAYSTQAVNCNSCDPAAIQARIAQGTGALNVIRAGQLNLEDSVTFGSPEQPVILMLDGINTNRKLTLNVYGSLIINQSLNANTELDIQVLRSNQQLEDEGNLWVKGDIHLNQNSSVQADHQLFAGNLIYNNGTLQVRAARMLVKGNLNINTRVDMNASEEITVGELVSNNETANLTVAGDFFVKGNASVNNNLNINTGGWFVVGGNLVANKQPVIHTGSVANGQTMLKYTVSGLKADYYSGSDFTGDRLTKVDEQVQVEARPILPAPGFNDQDFSVRWTGQIQTEFTEEYQLELQTRGAVRLWVNDELLIDRWSPSNQGASQAAFVARAGQRYDIQIEYSSNDGNPQAVLYWQSKRQERERVPQTRLYPFGIPNVAAVPVESAITLMWQPVFLAEGYEVETDGVIHPINANPTYSYSGLEAGTSHTYRIRANSGDIIGDWSPLTVCWTLPGIPGNVQAASTSNSVSIKWDAVAGATGYQVETNNTIIDVGNKIQYTDSQLDSNMQRTYRVRAYNSSGPGKWSALTVAVTLPGIPSNLSGKASDEAITVTWDPVSGATSYDLEIDDSLITGVTNLKYTHAPVEPASVHVYRIRANNDDGHSDWSQPITVNVKPSVPAYEEGAVSSSSVLIRWAPAQGAVRYEVEVDGVNFSVGEERQFDHQGLAPGTEHSYRVRAWSGEVPGEWSLLKRVITWPKTPANVQAVTVNSTTVEVTWDTVTGASGYELEVDGAVLTGDLNTAYRHTGLSPNTTHTYRVRAWNAGGVGEWSSPVTKTTGLGQPQNIASYAMENAIQLKWDPVDGATGYEVLVDGVLLNNGSSTQFEHTGLEPFSRHVYRVRATSMAGIGDWSEAVSSLTSLGTPRIIDIQSSGAQIDFTWNEVTGAAGYEVEADGVIISTGTEVSYSHKNLQPNTSHTYRVRAINGEVNGEWSNWSSLATKATSPKIPSNVTAAATTTGITLTWDKVMGAISYDVEIDGQVVPGVTDAKYVHGGLDPNTMHTYRVSARGYGGYSPWSEKILKATLPELTIDVGQDTEFNFVFVVPRKAGKEARTITVSFNPNELEVLDLSAITPENERTTGQIQGTNMVVTRYEPGTIVYKVYDAGQTIVNSIRFRTKTNEYSKITYEME